MDAKFRSADRGFVASVVGGGVDVNCGGGGVKDGNDYGMTVGYTGEESMITDTGTIRTSFQLIIQFLMARYLTLFQLSDWVLLSPLSLSRSFPSLLETWSLLLLCSSLPQDSASLLVVLFLSHIGSPGFSTSTYLVTEVRLDSSEFRRSRLLKLSCFLRRCNSCSISKMSYIRGMTCQSCFSCGMTSPVFGKEVVNVKLCVNQEVSQFSLLFVTSVVNLWDVHQSFDHDYFRKLGKDGSEDFKLRIESSVAFSNLKLFLLGDKLKIKFGLLSSNGRHDSAKIFHRQFIYKQINISLMDNLDHEE
ncbi:hypothetical protein Tco_1312115 [Tanacetum coccineum]